VYLNDFGCEFEEDLHETQCRVAEGEEDEDARTHEALISRLPACLRHEKEKRESVCVCVCVCKKTRRDLVYASGSALSFTLFFSIISRALIKIS
jgi:hypothetical protein